MQDQIKQLTNSVSAATEEVLRDLIALRTNRPTAKLVEDIKVEVYNQSMPLKQLGSISITPPREITVSIWDNSIVASVSQAISEALELNPVVDGNLIRVNLPALTEERRREISKVAGRIAEEGRIKIRSLREQINKKIDAATKDGSITEDDKFKFREDIQKIIDVANNQIEESLERKIKEIKD